MTPMTTSTFFQRFQFLILVLVALLGSVVLGSFIASERLESYVTTVEDRQVAQLATLTSMAELTARNGVDDVVQALVQDCPVDERVRFDELLGQLDRGLSAAELTEVDELFAGCASYQADRKAIMVSRLAREVAIYADYVELLAILTGSDAADEYAIPSWERLLAFEQTQSASLNELVVAQKSIIDTLRSGKASDSPEMIQILAGVRETQENLLFAGTQATTLRTELTSM